MLLSDERHQIVAYGRKLLSANLTVGTGGNLSIFNRSQGLIAIKPSGVDYLSMTPEDVMVITPKGEVVEGSRTPSSETPLHLALLHRRPDINAVVHTHSVYAATLACLHWELPAVHYLVGFSGDRVPLAPYALFGTQELADRVANAIGDYNACLMANHGLVCVGPTLPRAFTVAEEIEFVARIYLQARAVGEPRLLSAEQMDEVMRKFGTYRPPTPKD